MLFCPRCYTNCERGQARIIERAGRRILGCPTCGEPVIETVPADTVKSGPVSVDEPLQK